jgi:hypothetical protein
MNIGLVEKYTWRKDETHVSDISPIQKPFEEDSGSHYQPPERLPGSANFMGGLVRRFRDHSV